jgi:hypothetical protein
MVSVEIAELAQFHQILSESSPFASPSISSSAVTHYSKAMQRF